MGRRVSVKACNMEKRLMRFPGEYDRSKTKWTKDASKTSCIHVSSPPALLQLTEGTGVSLCTHSSASVNVYTHV